MNYLQELKCNESPHYVTPRYPLHVKQKLVCTDLILYSESPTSSLFVYLFCCFVFCHFWVFFSARSHTTYLHDTKIHWMRELKIRLDIISGSCHAVNIKADVDFQVGV